MAALQVASVTSGLIGIRLVNIPMFFCIRRTTTAWILLLEYFWLGRVAEPRIQASVAIICVAALIAGWDSLNSDLLGYFMATLNNIFTAGSSIAQKRFSEQVKLSSFGQLYCSASLSAPLVAALMLVSGEVPYVLEFPYWSHPGFLAGFIVSSVLGLAIAYTAMLCVTYNSPLAMSITGNIKDLATTTLGWALFGDFIATAKSVGGLMLSFSGAGLYSYVSLQKAMASKAAPAGDAAPTAATAPQRGATAPAAGEPSAAAPASTTANSPHGTRPTIDGDHARGVHSPGGGMTSPRRPGGGEGSDVGAVRRGHALESGPAAGGGGTVVDEEAAAETDALMSVRR
jgi:hypothetical protein